MKKKVLLITKLLDKYFPHPKCPLYFVNSYTLLIATLLSAKCQDERVNQVTKKLFLFAKTPKEMVKINKKKLEKILYPLGLYKTKAKRVLSLSSSLLKNFNGEVPDSYEALESLPGVGHKTASVVLALGFHKDTFPVDTHIHRLAKRWKLSLGKNVLETEKDLKKLFLKKSWKKIHLQMILYGRKFCKAKGHSPNDCPICKALKSSS